MALHTARRAANINGKVRGCVCGAVCHFVVEQVFSGAFEEAMRWFACGVVDAGCCLLVYSRLVVV